MEVKKGENSHHLLYCTILSSARHCTFARVQASSGVNRRRNKKKMNGKGKLFYVLGKIFISLRLDERRNGKKSMLRKFLFIFLLAKGEKVMSKSLIFFFPSLLTTYLCSIKTDFRYLTFSLVLLVKRTFMLHRTSNVIYYSKFYFQEVRQNIHWKFIFWFIWSRTKFNISLKYFYHFVFDFTFKCV